MQKFRGTRGGVFCLQTEAVCYTAVFSVVTQRLWGGVLRDKTTAKNDCVAD